MLTHTFHANVFIFKNCCTLTIGVPTHAISRLYSDDRIISYKPLKSKPKSYQQKSTEIKMRIIDSYSTTK